MVIRPPNVDQQVVASLKLVPMIGDVGGQIGIFSVVLLDDAILFVTECRGTESESAFLFEQKPAGFRFVQDLLHGPRLKERRFAEPRLKINPEG